MVQLRTSLLEQVYNISYQTSSNQLNYVEDSPETWDGALVADPKSEASKILEILPKYIPSRWDGKSAILELKEANYQW